MWKIDPKNKCTQIPTWSHLRIYVDHVCNSGTVEGTREKKERKRKEWIVSKYIVSVWEDDIAKCTESCWITGSRGKGEGEWEGLVWLKYNKFMGEKS
jgi:hypothetical protein